LLVYYLTTKKEEGNSLEYSFSSYRGPTRSTGTPSLIATSSTVSDSGEKIVKRFASAHTVTG
jgi:hypothetical protein